LNTPLTSGQRTALRGLAFTLLLVVVLVWVFFVSGCQVAQWRVFQKKVDGADGVKPAAQVEGEKRAAAYIAKRSEPPKTETVLEMKTALGDIHVVATNLSSSLGQPAKAVTLEDKDAVIASLRQGLAAKDAQLERWRAFGRKYAGTPLEDTGINLAGPAGLLAFAAVIAAVIFVPGFGYVLLRLLPVLWAALKRSVAAVEAVASKAPEAVAAIKAALPQKEDGARKAVRLAKRRAVAAQPLAA
jgi:hypothetical protein